MLFRVSAALAVLVVLPLVIVEAVPTVDAAVLDTTPRRVLDTRVGLGAPTRPVAPGEVLRLTINGVPTSGETVVMLNLTNAQAARAGHVSAWSCADPTPDTSVLNFVPRQSTANMVALEYTAAGLCFSTSTSVNLVADLTSVATDGEVHGIPARRLLDTRTASRLRAGRELQVAVGGSPGIPSNAAAAGLNIAVVRPAGNGHLLVEPCGGGSTTSSLNFGAGEAVPHFTFSALTGGAVCITSTVDTDLIVDSFAWTDSASDVRAIPPSRVLDSRFGVGARRGSVASGELIRFRVAGYGGVANNSSGVTINLTAIRPTGPAFVNAWPCGTSEPTTSAINVWPGQVRANQVLLSLPASGEVCLRPVVSGGGSIELVADAVTYTRGSVSRPAPPATTSTTSTTTTVPSTGGAKFPTLPVGAALPSGATCASRVRSAPEVRPANGAANANRGSRAVANNRTDWPGFDRVDGDFAGTTDEIIQWAACKWGIDEDIVRAQIVKESNWYQSANGDNGESWGLGQVRDTAHQSAFEYSSVNARNSSAYNLDYTYASWRACYEGAYTWLNQFERGAQYGPGDVWGCLGVWFAGRWYTQPAINYIEDGDTGGYGTRGVRTHYELRTWESQEFLNS